MLIDSPQIVEGSAIQNTTIGNGPSFPLESSMGELFYLVDVAQSPTGELYSSNGQEWSPVGASSGPEVKPRPMLTQPLSGDRNFGSAADHNLHYRGALSTTMTITVQPDEFWTGTQLYWEQDYSPSSPAAMPIGGSAMFGKHSEGNLEFVAGAGVTINTPHSLLVDQLHGKIMIIKVAPNTWDLEGNVAQ